MSLLMRCQKSLHQIAILTTSKDNVMTVKELEETIDAFRYQLVSQVCLSATLVARQQARDELKVDSVREAAIDLKSQ